MTEHAWNYRLTLIVSVIAAGAGLIVGTPTAEAADHPTVTTSGDPASPGQALTLVNRERAEAGCPSLRVVAKLQTPAGRQSRDQAARDRSGHDGANGSRSNSRLRGLGYARWAENVAQFQSAQETVSSWSTSPGHRANMLNCVFRDTGMAVARSNSGRLYWTQTFGG